MQNQDQVSAEGLASVLGSINSANIVNEVVLAVGEWHTDGAHSHKFTGSFYHASGKPNETNLFSVESDVAVLNHEEHGPMVQNKGSIIRSVRQLEYDPIEEASRRVLD
jgi:hypothetical protein